jgi:hypothetical protein
VTTISTFPSLAVAVDEVLGLYSQGLGWIADRGWTRHGTVLNPTDGIETNARAFG